MLSMTESAIPRHDYITVGTLVEKFALVAEKRVNVLNHECNLLAGLNDQLDVKAQVVLKEFEKRSTVLREGQVDIGTI